MPLRRFLSVILFLFLAVSAPSLLLAQDSGSVEKVEVFGGYSWYRAGGSIPTAVVDGQTIPGGTVPDFNKGGSGQLIYNLNHWAGLAVDGSGHSNDFGRAYSITAGPQFSVRKSHFTGFVEVLLGVQVIDPKQLPSQSTGTLIAGGGIDYRVDRRFSLRLLQADYVNSYYNKFTPSTTSNEFTGTRLQAGLVVNFGLPHEATVSAVCTAQPETVQAGVPVRVSVVPENFSPKGTLSYSYVSTGKISNCGALGVADTSGLAPGEYTVSARVVDLRKKGKRQPMADCQTSFKVIEVPKIPPTLSVSAEPTAITTGDSSVITATGSSADNRPLSYNCTTTAGRLIGNGPRYTLETAGVPEGTVEVNCTVSDNNNLTASASVPVKVNAVAKVAAVAAAAKSYGAIGFQRDIRRPTRVDNEAKGELDRYADALAAAPDSKGVVVGYATANEDKAVQGGKSYAAQRAVNTKDYLTKEKGIDPARIEVRAGSGDQKVELWIVPPGAVFPKSDTTAVDEVMVKAVPRVALKKKRKPVHRKVPPQDRALPQEQ